MRFINVHKWQPTIQAWTASESKCKLAQVLRKMTALNVSDAANVRGCWLDGTEDMLCWVEWLGGMHAQHVTCVQDCHPAPDQALLVLCTSMWGRFARWHCQCPASELVPGWTEQAPADKAHLTNLFLLGVTIGGSYPFACQLLQNIHTGKLQLETLCVQYCS